VEEYIVVFAKKNGTLMEHTDKSVLRIEQIKTDNN